MAFELGENVGQQPEATLLQSYRVERGGRFPLVVLSFAEVSKAWANSTLSVVGVDADEDGLFEALTLEDWDGQNLVGQKLFDQTKTLIGTVTAMDAATFTLNAPIAVLPTQVWLEAFTSIGTLSWDVVPGGRQWEIALPMNSPALVNYVGGKLGAALFNAVKAVLALTSASVTDLEILGAIQTLAAQGLNVDSYIAAQGELIELNRRAGTTPVGISVAGNAPAGNSP